MQGSRRDSLDLGHPGRVFLATTLIALAIDQLTKAIVRSHLSTSVSIVVVPGILRLTHVLNVGAAFGLLPGRQPVFMLTSLLVLFVIAAYWRRAHPRQWPVVIALALVTAGAAGNLIDRAVFGRVTDFFEFAFMDFPVFNVADMCILFGVLILMGWILFEPQGSAEQHEGAPEDEQDGDGDR